jgi:hypothetical protein
MRAKNAAQFVTFLLSDWTDETTAPLTEAANLSPTTIIATVSRVASVEAVAAIRTALDAAGAKLVAEKAQ